LAIVAANNTTEIIQTVSKPVLSVVICQKLYPGIILALILLKENDFGI